MYGSIGRHLPWLHDERTRLRLFVIRSFGLLLSPPSLGNEDAEFTRCANGREFGGRDLIHDDLEPYVEHAE